MSVAQFRGLSGEQLLVDPILNKGTAFTEAERDLFSLHGLLPPHVGTLAQQVDRRLSVLRAFRQDINRYAFLRDLQDSNETLFFALLTQHLEEFLPIVYTPTVGEGCQRFSALYRRPRGLYLSIPHIARLDQILANPRFDRVSAIVVTDGERILGLGDQGAGGMGIPIGKLALYTACAGLHPSTTLPIFLDVGTDNAACIEDPLYIGWRHARVRGPEYDEFIEAFVGAVTRRWPHVMLQWEDFAKGNATRLLEKYRDRLCTFNDDVQGTAAVATGALLAAINATGVPLTEQRITVLGAGSAGCGIAMMLHDAMVNAGVASDEAFQRITMVDRFGLLQEGMPDVAPFQIPFLKTRSTIAQWTVDDRDNIPLLSVIRNAKPTTLIGVSGQPGAFSEDVVRTMAANHARPVIFPLSNPTSRAEATPADIERWTDGRAVIGTGTPFAPLTRNGRPFKVDQTNNSYVFPGIALGAIAVRATKVSDRMLMVAATTLASMSPASRDPQANLLPPVTDLRHVARQIAEAVAAEAVKERLADPAYGLDDVPRAVEANMWTPAYEAYAPDGSDFS